MVGVMVVHVVRLDLQQIDRARPYAALRRIWFANARTAAVVPFSITLSSVWKWSSRTAVPAAIRS